MAHLPGTTSDVLALLAANMSAGAKMRILRVGDPHVKVSNLEESKRLLLFILEMAEKYRPDRIEILGDLFHTHAIMRVEVLDFWTYWLEALSEQFEVVVLVGNHDRTGDHNSDLSALDIFMRLDRPKLHVVRTEKRMGIYGYISYCHSGDSFIDTANRLVLEGAKVIVCHQTFDGSRFENGFYAPEGIDASKINAPVIISGHIHAQQEIGKVWYPGTARWDTASDANQIKGIWICDHNDDGLIVSKELIKTDGVCTPIVSFEWKEGEPEPAIPEGARATVELIGTSSWISQVKQSLKGKASVKTKITDSAKLQNRKSGASLQDFVMNIYATSVDKEKLIKYMKELDLV